MGLSIEVGILVDLEEHDAEGAEYWRSQFVEVNKALAVAKLPPHVEPTGDIQTLPWSTDMWGYSGIHHLRRIAAHLWAGLPLPPPGDRDASDDPVLARYYTQMGQPRPPTLVERFTGRKKHAETGPRFDHLLLHSDAEGVYLPADFPDVVFSMNGEEVAGGMIGSAPRLLEECLRLAAVLGVPPDLDPEADALAEAAQEQGTGEGWRRYGVEAFTCVKLIAACRACIASGAAITFG